MVVGGEGFHLLVIQHTNATTKTTFDTADAYGYNSDFFAQAGETMYFGLIFMLPFIL